MRFPARATPVSPRVIAQKRIRIAFYAAIGCVVFQLGGSVLGVAGDTTLSRILPVLIEPVALASLAVWLLVTKNRVAALLLSGCFVAGKVAFFITMADMFPAQQTVFAAVLGRHVMWLCMFGLAFVQGIRGSFAYHRLTVHVPPPA